MADSNDPKPAAPAADSFRGHPDPRPHPTPAPRPKVDCARVQHEAEMLREKGLRELANFLLLATGCNAKQG